MHGAVFTSRRVGNTPRLRASPAAWSVLDLPEEHPTRCTVLQRRNATDAGVPTIKGYHWWRAAAALLPREGSASGLRIAAKVDDDSFVHLGNLVSAISPVCATHQRTTGTRARFARFARSARGGHTCHHPTFCADGF